jgi:hypothetical protein
MEFTREYVSETMKECFITEQLSKWTEVIPKLRTVILAAFEWMNE